MKNYKLMLCVLGCVLAFMVAAPAVNGPRLTFKFSTANVPGALSTSLNDINNAGTMVGQYEDANGVFHGYILSSSGELTTLDDPNGTKTSAGKIQYNGTSVVGGYANSSWGRGGISVPEWTIY